MSPSNNFISQDSIFNLHINPDSWNDIKEYIHEYKQVIKIRDAKRQPIAHRSPQDGYRPYLVQYLKDVAVKKELSHCCLHLAIYIMDLFMDNHSITKQKLLLLVHVCLWISGKMEDSKKIVKLTDIAASNSNFPSSDYRNLEILILKYFNFDIMFPTPALYTHYYIQAALNKKDLNKLKVSFTTAIDRLHIEIRRYLDKILGDIHYNQQCYPSLMAAAIISAARLKIGLPGWTIQMETLTDYSEADIESTRILLEKPVLTCQRCKKTAGSPTSVLSL